MREGMKGLMEAEQDCERIQVSEILPPLLDTCSAITDYRTLRDSFPRRLAYLFKCRCVLFYQCIEETLQFASGSFDDKPGWSAGLLSVVHINPVSFSSDVPETRAWRERHAIAVPAISPTHIATPLIYRQRVIGVLVAIRGNWEDSSGNQEWEHYPPCWAHDEVRAVGVVAGIVAMLLENTRLLERDRERIHELSLLNSISNQIHDALYEEERVKSIVIQRTREISKADLCDVIEPSTEEKAESWIPLVLREKLFSYFDRQPSSLALIFERFGDVKNPRTHEYLQHLPSNIKTFFALPLVSGHTTSERKNGEFRYVGRRHNLGPKTIGIVVGAYHHAWRMRREESMLLQVIVGQASAVLENIALMTEVMEARNQARKLLRQVVEDMASVHRLEEEKRRLDRLATLGEMAANVAHEVRNPLASIKTSIQMLVDDLTEERDVGNDTQPNTRFEWIQESTSVMLKEVERLDTIVRDLLSFARPRRMHYTKCNMVELSNHVLQLMLPQCEESHIVIHRLYSSVLPLWADIGQIEQILFNLYTNAVQAMPEGGCLTVSCQVADDEHRACHQATLTRLCRRPQGSPDASQKQWLEFQVADTGVGIAPDSLERIFQPFFTTKAHGIGLGLSITRRLVEDHGGSLSVESRPKDGTTISLRFPLMDNAHTWEEECEGERGE